MLSPQSKPGKTSANWVIGEFGNWVIVSKSRLPVTRYPLPNYPTTQLPNSRANEADYLVAFLRHHLRRPGLQVEPQQRFRIGRPDIEMPVRVLDRDPVQLVLMPVGVAGRDLAELGRDHLHALKLGVDLARDEVLTPQRLEQLVQAEALLRHQLQNQQRRNEAVVGVEVLAEVIVPRDLAAENRVGFAHPAFEKRMTD